MKSYIQDALSKGFTSMSSEKDYIKDGMKSLIETIQGELSKISNNDNKSLIERLDKIEEKLLKNNIDNNEESDILLDKITEAIDNNADVINSERFSTMLEENPEVLRKLKIVYKNDNKVLKKLNKF
jgi:fructose-1,6-bisphosphatase